MEQDTLTTIGKGMIGIGLTAGAQTVVPIDWNSIIHWTVQALIAIATIISVFNKRQSLNNKSNAN